MQEPSRFLEDIPPDLLAGMVDRQRRREGSYQRVTSWEADNTRPQSRSQTGGYWTGRSKSAPPATSTPTPGQPPAKSSPPGAGPNYWSPGAGANAQKPAKPAASGSALKFKRRDSVQHASFGIGTVIESEATRDGDEQVTVAFPGVGIKKLLVSLANLKKL
jgi:DNA helicase-2/ATP-dependent DNA helicase PcrA